MKTKIMEGLPVPYPDFLPEVERSILQTPQGFKENKFDRDMTCVIGSLMWAMMRARGPMGVLDLLTRFTEGALDLPAQWREEHGEDMKLPPFVSPLAADLRKLFDKYQALAKADKAEVLGTALRQSKN
jgi:hypothetical protein